MHSEAEHREAVGFALAAADSDARLGNLAGALGWLDLVEEMNLVIPPAEAEHRDRWEHATREDRTAGRPQDRR